MSNQKEKIICQICERELGIRGFWCHLKHKHHLTYKEYYDIYRRKEGEGICPECGKETTLYRGNYLRFCSSRCAVNNPEIKERRIEIYSQTLKDNPEIVENRKETRKQTMTDNPEIEKMKTEKRLETLKNNPDIMIESGKATSIGLRNYHKSLHKNDSEETHYLYIMENQTKPIIKIGLTLESQLKTRMNRINNVFGESKQVLLLKGTYKNIDELETFLHDYFNEHCKVQPIGCGKTEWFDKKIMAEAIELASAK